MKRNLLFAKSSATVLSCAAFSYAGEVQAPPSIKGATITIEFEEANLIRRETLEYDEIIESAYSELVYVPKKEPHLFLLAIRIRDEGFIIS